MGSAGKNNRLNFEHIRRSPTPNGFLLANQWLTMTQEAQAILYILYNYMHILAMMFYDVKLQPVKTPVASGILSNHPCQCSLVILSY